MDGTHTRGTATRPAASGHPYVPEFSPSNPSGSVNIPVFPRGREDAETLKKKCGSRQSCFSLLLSRAVTLPQLACQQVVARTQQCRAGVAGLFARMTASTGARKAEEKRRKCASFDARKGFFANYIDEAAEEEPKRGAETAASADQRAENNSTHNRRRRHSKRGEKEGDAVFALRQKMRRTRLCALVLVLCLVLFSLLLLLLLLLILVFGPQLYEERVFTRQRLQHELLSPAGNGIAGGEHEIPDAHRNAAHTNDRGGRVALIGGKGVNSILVDSPDGRIVIPAEDGRLVLGGGQASRTEVSNTNGNGENADVITKASAGAATEAVARSHNFLVRALFDFFGVGLGGEHERRLREQAVLDAVEEEKKRVSMLEQANAYTENDKGFTDNAHGAGRRQQRRHGLPLPANDDALKQILQLEEQANGAQANHSNGHTNAGSDHDGAVGDVKRRKVLDRRGRQLEELAAWLSAIEGKATVTTGAKAQSHLVTANRALPQQRQQQGEHHNEETRTARRAFAAAAETVTTTTEAQPGGGLRGDGNDKRPLVDMEHFVRFYHKLKEAFDDETIAALAQGRTGAALHKDNDDDSNVGEAEGETDKEAGGLPGVLRYAQARRAMLGFARVTGATAREHKRLRPMDELEVLKYRHAFIQKETTATTISRNKENLLGRDLDGVGDDEVMARLQRYTANRNRKDALYASATTALNRLYYFPLQRFERFLPYTTETVRSTDAWYTPIAAEFLLHIGAATGATERRDSAERRKTKNAYLRTGDPYLPLSLFQNELRFFSPSHLQEVVTYFTQGEQGKFRNRENMLENVGNIAPLFSSVTPNGAAASRNNLHLWRLLQGLSPTPSKSEGITNNGGITKDNASRGSTLQTFKTQPTLESTAERLRVRRQLNKLLASRKQSVADETSIFVSLAAFRDVECGPTLFDLFEKAKNPRRVFAGIAEQNRWGDPSCLAQAHLFPPLPCYVPATQRVAQEVSEALQHSKKKLFSAAGHALSRVLLGTHSEVEHTKKARHLYARESGEAYEFFAQQRAYSINAERFPAKKAFSALLSQSRGLYEDTAANEEADQRNGFFERMQSGTEAPPHFATPLEKRTTYDPFFGTENAEYAYKSSSKYKAVSAATATARGLPLIVLENERGAPKTATNDFSLGLCFVAENIRVKRIRAGRAFGPTFGRYMAMLLYRGESLSLIIDSHNRFVPFWDSLGANTFLKYNDEKIGLSHYPESFPYGNSENPNVVRVREIDSERRTRYNAPPLELADEEDGHLLQKGAGLHRGTSAYLCKSLFWQNFGYVRLNGIVVHGGDTFYDLNHRLLAPYYRPAREERARFLNALLAGNAARNAAAKKRNFHMPQPWVAGGFLFTSYHAYREVPFDPHLPHVFDGEEVLYGMRLWTHGFTLFSPNTNLCYHFYTRATAPKVWLEAPAWYTTQATSRRRIQYLLRSHGKNIATAPMVSVQFNQAIIHDPKQSQLAASGAEAHILVDTDRYGMGRVRSVQQWYNFSGVDPVAHTVEGRFCGKN